MDYEALLYLSSNNRKKENWSWVGFELAKEKGGDRQKSFLKGKKIVKWKRCQQQTCFWVLIILKSETDNFGQSSKFLWGGGHLRLKSLSDKIYLLPFQCLWSQTIFKWKFLCTVFTLKQNDTVEKKWVSVILVYIEHLQITYMLVQNITSLMS